MKKRWLKLNKWHVKKKKNFCGSRSWKRQCFAGCNISNKVILIFMVSVFWGFVFWVFLGNVCWPFDIVSITPFLSTYNLMHTIKYNIKFNTDLLRNHLLCVIVTVCPVLMGRIVVLFCGNIYDLLFVIFRCFRVGFILHIYVCT